MDDEPEDISDILGRLVYESKVGFGYDPEIGRLWKIAEVKTTKERLESGAIVSRKVNTPGNIAKVVTHIMWRLMTGEWPKPGMFIDHKDGATYNTKWDNLREATPAQNAYNKESIGRYRHTDINMETGVYKENNRFAVSIGKVYYGRFDSVEEANAFCIKKREELHGEFAIHRRDK